MKNLILLALSLCLTMAYAQTNSESDSLKTSHLTVNASPEIEELLKSKEDNCSFKDVPKTYKVPEVVTVKKTTLTSTTNGSTYKAPTANVDICTQYPKISGIKIQIINTTDKEVAEKARAAFSSMYPGISANIEFKRPEFKVKVGDYFYKTSAAADYRSIKSKFPAALMVQASVNCRRAK